MELTERTVCSGAGAVSSSLFLLYLNNISSKKVLRCGSMSCAEVPPRKGDSLPRDETREHHAGPGGPYQSRRLWSE